MPFQQRIRLLLGSLSPSKFGGEISSFADPGCLSQIPDPGSDFFPSHTVKKFDEVVRHLHLVTQDQFTLVSEKVFSIPEENFTKNIELF